MAADDDLLWLEAFFERKDSDGDGTLGNDEVVVVLKALGLDGKPEHVRSLFERFDTDRSGQISFDEFAPFVKFLRGECDTLATQMHAKPFAGRNFTADLEGVDAGSEVVAFHDGDKMWYNATVDGVYPAPEPNGVYYVVTFNAVPGCKVADPVAGQQVSLFAASLRVRDLAMVEAVKHKVAQQKAKIEQRIDTLDELFVQVDQADDGEEGGDLGREAVQELLRLLGANATGDQVDLIFRHYDSDHSGTVSHDEFEMCLPVLMSGYTSPTPFEGINHEPEVTEDSSELQQERLSEGALVAAFHPKDGLWVRACVEAMHTAERKDGGLVHYFTVTYSSGESGVVYGEALRAKETELSHEAKEQLAAYDKDGDGVLEREEVIEYLQAEGMDASDEAVDQLFECYDEDGSGTLSSVEWESFLRVASGEAEDAAAPPAGASANLDTVTEGTQVLAFYAADELWYGATVEGVFPGKELQLPDGSIATTLYYTVRYNAYPETTEVLNDSSLRMPPPKADDDTQSAEELEAEMRKLFETVDVSHDGNLSPSEVMTLLEMEGLDSSEEHVAMLFERYDADGEGEISRIEFEPFLRAMRREKDGVADPPEPPDGTTGDLHLLKAGDDVLAFYAPESVWYPATLNGVYDTGDAAQSVYYSVTFTGYSEVETVYKESLRAKKESSFEERPEGAVGWIARKCGVRGAEELRYCHLHGPVLTVYAAEAMARPFASVDMRHVEHVGPCLAPKASNLEIGIRMKAGHVTAPIRMVCTTRQDRRRWLRVLGSHVTPSED